MARLKSIDISQLKTYNYIINVQDRLVQTKNEAVNFVFTLVFRILFAVTLLLFISGLSLFIVFLVQYQMLPVMLHTFPVHLQHSDCQNGVLNCPYPTAVMSFVQGKSSGREGPILMAGQKYSMWVELEVPESERNINAGTFMVKIELRSRDRLHGLPSATSKTAFTSSRAAILQYRSYIHQSLRVIFLFPLYLTGYLEERQKLKIDLIPSYQEDPFSPVMEAVIQLEKASIDVYKMILHVEAHLEGIRYYMQRHPFIIGTFLACLNFCCGVVLAAFSAYNRFARRESRKIKTLASAPEDGSSVDGDDLSIPDSFDPLEAVEEDSDDIFHKPKSSSMRHRIK